MNGPLGSSELPMRKRGRPPGPGTAQEKAAARRERVRRNVQNYRKRRNEQSRNDDDPIDQTRDPGTWSVVPRMSPETWRLERSGPVPIETRVDVGLLQVPDPGIQYTNGLLGRLVEIMLPKSPTVPESPSATMQPVDPCATWMTKAFTLATNQGGGALRDIMVAILLVVQGPVNWGPERGLIAQQLYMRGIRVIRQELGFLLTHNRLPGSRPLELYLACHAAALFEMAKAESYADVIRHLRGVGSILDHLFGSCWDAAASAVSNPMIQEFREFEIGFCMMQRRLPSYRSKREVIDTSKVADADNSQVRDAMMRLGDWICAIMVDFDRLTRAPLASNNLLEAIQSHEASLTKILQEIDIWLAQLMAGSTSEFPLAPDQARGFVNLTVGLTWSFAMAFKIHALETRIAVSYGLDRMQASPPQTSRRKAMGFRKDLLSSAYAVSLRVGYFFSSDRGLTGGAVGVFPLATSRKAFENERTRLIADSVFQAEQPSRESQLEMELNDRIRIAETGLDLCRQAEMTAHETGVRLYL
jgi:hypothetical protein